MRNTQSAFVELIALPLFVTEDESATKISKTSFSPQGLGYSAEFGESQTGFAEFNRIEANSGTKLI